MSWWRALRGAARRKGAKPGASQVEALTQSLEAIADQLHAIDATVRETRREVRDLQRQTELLAAVRAADSDAGSVLDRLEPVLDAGRVTAHVRDAVARSRIATHPVPHLVVAEVLPNDVYQALVDAVPPDVCFPETGEDAHQLSLPLALAPIHSIATWAFMTRVVRGALGEALAAAFDAPVNRLLAVEAGPDEATPHLAASRGRIARRQPGDVVPEERRRRAHVLTTILPLTMLPAATEVRLSAQGGTAPGGAVLVAPNSAITVLSLIGSSEYGAVPPTRSDGAAFYAYEFPIGPDADTMRKLTAAARGQHAPPIR